MPDRLTLTEKFAARLRREISAGRYVCEKPIPSERTLARQYGISRVTARRSLKRLCDERLIEARPARGYFVVPGAVEQRRAGEARAVLFVQRSVPGQPMLDSMHTEIVNGALAEAQGLGLEVYIVCQELTEFRQSLKDHWGQGLRGVLLDWSRPDIARVLLEEDVPFVLVETDVAELGVSCVIQDNTGGIISALAHLADQGHRRIAMIVSSEESVHVRQRLAGYREHLLRSGLPASPNQVIFTSPDAAGGRRAICQLLETQVPPSAVLVCHREMISGVVEELSERGLDYPRDVSLVVWGQPQSGTQGGEVTDVTHLAWNKEEMGQLAVRALEERIAAGHPERMVMRIATRLVDCGSVAAPANRKT